MLSERTFFYERFPYKLDKVVTMCWSYLRSFWHFTCFEYLEGFATATTRNQDAIASSLQRLKTLSLTQLVLVSLWLFSRGVHCTLHCTALHSALLRAGAFSKWRFWGFCICRRNACEPKPGVVCLVSAPGIYCRISAGIYHQHTHPLSTWKCNHCGKLHT